MALSYPNKPNSSTSGLSRAGLGFLRSLVRRCPFCSGSHIFQNWFTLKDQCASCGSVFAPEDGYMLGSYVVNLGLTAVIGVLFAMGIILGTGLSVLTMQIAAVALVVGLPLFLYGYSQLFWICIDLVFNSTAKFDPHRQRHT